MQWGIVFLSREGTQVGLSAAVERGPSEGARSGSTGPTWAPFPSFQARLFYLSGNGARAGSTAAVERAHSDRARSGSKRPTRVPVLPLFLRVSPRIPCWFHLPRINRISLPLSELLNFPQLPLAFLSSKHRHSGCSSTGPSTHGTDSRKGGEVGLRPPSNIEC